MLIVTQLTQSWYKRTMPLHVLHVSAYCVHHQVYRAFTITFPYTYYTSLHWPVFTNLEYLVQVSGLCNAFML
jgi:hypothetical protein